MPAYIPGSRDDQIRKGLRRNRGRVEKRKPDFEEFIQKLTTAGTGKFVGDGPNVYDMPEMDINARSKPIDITSTVGADEIYGTGPQNIPTERTLSNARGVFAEPKMTMAEFTDAPTSRESVKESGSFVDKLFGGGQFTGYSDKVDDPTPAQRGEGLFGDMSKEKADILGQGIEDFFGKLAEGEQTISNIYAKGVGLDLNETTRPKGLKDLRAARRIGGAELLDEKSKENRRVDELLESIKRRGVERSKSENESTMERMKKYGV